MTYEEALNFNQKWTAEQARNDLERYLLRNEPCAYKAIALAMQALEKQMPKKPYLDNDSGVHDKQHCPTCHRSLFPNDHHCLCGQAIDWSDT